MEEENEETSRPKRDHNWAKWIKENPMATVAIFIAVFIFAASIIGHELQSFRRWQDYAAFLQTLPCIIGPIGAAIALHYAGKRTAQMARQTNAQLAANNQKLFFDALSYLTGSEDHLRLTGLASLRNDIFALKDDFF